ncbi:MAG: heavy-metal-associated domain-containing protein, partial [Pseudomonadota bacterium]
FAFTLPVTMADNQGTDTTQQAATTQTMVTAKVKGMVCDFCARAVTKVFGKNEAVKNVHVDLDTQEIHVTLKPGGYLSDETVGDLVKKSGYTLVSVAREPS